MASQTRRELRKHLLVSILAVVALVACTPPTLPTASYNVTLIIDGEPEQYETQVTTIGDLLKEAGVVLEGEDRVHPSEVTGLRDGMTITVVRVSHTDKVVTQTIPFERQVVRDRTVPEGESRLLQAGRPGILERRYRMTFEDHQEVDRFLAEEVMIEAPKDEVWLLGTKPTLQNTSIEGTLAYLSNQDAWIMRDSTFQRRRLTHFGDLDGRVFALSPDGQQLLFTRTTTDTEVLNQAWLVNTVEAASEARPLDLQDLLWAGWSPTGDDGTIAWTTAEVIEQAPGWRGHNDLWTGRVTTSGTLAARTDVLPTEAGGGHGWWGTRYAWAPDGERLAYMRPEVVGILDLTAPRAERRFELISFPALRTFSSWAWHPAVSWSSDGTFLSSVVHVSAEGEEEPEESPVFNLLTLEATGRYSATLAVEVGAWATPHFSPDGDVLLFGRAIIPYQSATSRYTLHLVDRDGSNQRQIYAPTGDTGLEIPAWTWSPDGKAIAFILNGDIQLLPLTDVAPAALTDEGNVTAIDWRP